jgi:hypothetical protein
MASWLSTVITALVPIVSAALTLRLYSDRALAGRASRTPSRSRVLLSGAANGALTTVMLGLLGIALAHSPLAARDTRPLTLANPLQWVAVFAVSALIGAALGLATAAMMEPWLRRRLAADPAPASAA